MPINTSVHFPKMVADLHEDSLPIRQRPANGFVMEHLTWVLATPIELRNHMNGAIRSFAPAEFQRPQRR